MSAERRLLSTDDPRVRAAKREIRYARSRDMIEEAWRPSEIGLRSAPTSVGWQIVGHALVYNQISDDLGGFRERIAPGALTAVLRSKALDTRALFNHNMDMVLGRVKSGTLRLADTPQGLRYVVDPPATTYAENLLALLERGDVDQSSFAFRVAKNGETWEEADDGLLLRTITKLSDLFDVSPVTMPAYPQTDAGVASSPLEDGRTNAPESFPHRAALDRAVKRLERLIA